MHTERSGRELRFSIFNLLLFMTVVVWPAGVLEAKYSGGSGTAGAPYQIGFAADLLALTATSAHAGLKWSYAPNGGPIYYSSPAIGPGGTIYVGSGAPFAYAPTRGLYAVNPDGTLKWQYTSAEMPNMYTPSVGEDGTIYVQDAFSSLYAVNPDGTLKWNYPLNTRSEVGQTAPALAADGTIYVGADTLYAINSDGTLKWRDVLIGGAFDIYVINYIRSSPAIAPDGTIYVGATGTFSDFSTGNSGGAVIMAVNSDGTLKWKYILQSATFSSPAIGADGTICVGTDTSDDLSFVYAINPDGTLKWRYDITGGRAVRSSPAIGVDGTIYIGTKAGATTNAGFLALDPDGTLKWEYSIDVGGGDIYCSPAIGADGIIHFGAETGFLYALDPDGTLAWKYGTNNGINWTSPAIDCNGTVYIGNNDGKLFAIDSSSMGLAGSPWPKFRHDNKNTGNWSSKEPVTITTASPLPTGAVGSAYNVALQASGGTGPYTWSVVSNSLPSGLSLSSGGVISGTPSAAGTASFTVQVTDNDGLSSTKAFSLTINLVPTSLTIHTVGQGSVTKNPDQATYSYADTVDLTAIPDVGWSFDSWSGDLSGSANPDTITIDGNKTVTAKFTMNGAGEMSVTKCTVIAGSKDNSDKISISGSMGATADDFSGASIIEVTVDSDDIVNPCVQTFAIDGKTFKKGKYSYSGTENGVKKSFKYDVKTHKFTFSASNIDLSGLGCPVAVEIRVGDYVGTAQVDEATVNGPKKPIPLRLMMGVKNVLRVDSCKVTAGEIAGHDTILVSGEMSVTADEMSDADNIQVTVDSVDMVSPCVQSFPIDDESFKKGKYNYAITENASKISFTFDTKTGKFSFTAKNVDLSGLACPLTIEVVISDHICTDEVDEAIVNGPKSPIPIKLMMGVKNSLRVDKLQVKRGKNANSDQLSVKGGFAVEDINVNLVIEEFVVTLGTQTFTLPAGSFEAGKSQFTCSKAGVTEGGTADVTFNFKTCSFTITIKNTEIAAGSGAANFSVEFGGYSQVQQITLP